MVSEDPKMPTASEIHDLLIESGAMDPAKADWWYEITEDGEEHFWQRPRADVLAMNHL